VTNVIGIDKRILELILWINYCVCDS